MSNSTSNSSVTGGSVGIKSVLTGTLSLPRYHFKAESTCDLSHGENIDIVHGWRVSTQEAVVAKVAANSLRLEREYYVMKKLYHYSDGPSFLVRPVEFIKLPSGLTVAIYADEGHSQQQFVDDYFSSKQSANRCSKSDNEQDISTTDQEHHCTGNHEKVTRNNQQSSTSSKGDTGYDLCTFLRFAIKCLTCLEYIHKHNVVHGEIRLNAFQWNGSDDGAVKLWNFGSGSKSLESYLTSEGWRKTANNKELVGVLHSLLIYMSPEQTGRTTHSPDHRTDIYSMGIVMFVLLTGKSPFDGGPLEILNGVLSRKIPLVHEIQFDTPEMISKIIEKMTSKASDDRYSSARGVRYDFEECLKRLKMADDLSTEVIPSFPLAQNDIASVFTLPKHIYGRQDTISELQFIIKRCAALHNSVFQRSHSRVNAFRTGIQANVISENYATDMTLTTNSDSFDMESSSQCSTGGFGESDVSSVSSRMFVNNGKPATTIVGVYGPGGIGKSTLFTSVQPTARHNGYIATVKFDSRNKVPYSTIFKALSQILQQILTESEDMINAFYEHLRVSLASQFCNIHLVIDFIPELKPLLKTSGIGKESGRNSAVQVDNIEARARFHKVYVEVFRAITRWSMVTLFMDDLHQADDPSLELMESLIMSRVNILILLSYRDQEISNKQSEFLANKTADLHLIKVNPLQMDSLVDLLCDTLHRSREVGRDAVLPLAEIIATKTNGNVFFATQLIRTLERKKLIYFNWEKNEWSFDLQNIEESVSLGYHNNINSQLDVSFIVARLRELPPAGQSFLKWASYVGDTFSWETVKNLMLSEERNEDSGDENKPNDNKRMATKNNNYNTSRRTSIIKHNLAANGHLDPSQVACRAHSYDCSNSNNNISSNEIDDVDDNNDAVSSSNSMSTFSVNDSGAYYKRSTTSTTSSSTGSYNDPINGLQTVLQEGYIMSLGGDEFKWSHDRISQAAAELADTDARSKIHFTIAQHLMKKKQVDTFLVADHLLKCQDILATIEDKQYYRKIMLEAGMKGQSAGAHSMAFSYYNVAISLGNPFTDWSEFKYKTTLHLYTNAVALSWVVGQYDKTEELLSVIFANAKSAIDRMPAYRVQAQFYYASQLHEEGRDTLFKCLNELGDEITQMDTSDESLELEFNQAEEHFEKLGTEGVLDLELCDDILIKGTIGVMDELIALTYWSGRKSEAFYWACRVVNLSLTRGLTSATGNACMTAALGYGHVFKKYNFAEKLAATGIQLADMHGTIQDKGRAYCLYPVFGLQWKYHQREAFRYFNISLEYAMSAGDRIYGAFSLVWIPILKFFTGHSLNDTVRVGEEGFEEIHSWSPALDHNSLVMCVIRTCKALQGKTYIDTPQVFDGDDGFNDEHFLEESCRQTANVDVLLNWYESFKIIPLVLYGHLDAAIEIGNRCFGTIEGHPCHRHTRMMAMYFSLALIEKARRDSKNRQVYIDQVQKNQELIYGWMLQTPINYGMWWTLIEAELSSIETPLDVVKTGRLYEDAINLAREGSWYLELCVIHEYAGSFYNSIGFQNVSYGLIKKAINLYTCHGSYGKVEHLNTKYDILLSEFDDNRRESVETSTQTDPIPVHRERTWSTTSSQPLQREEEPSKVDTSQPYTSQSIPAVTAEKTLLSLDILDMASILKSSQVMSSEVKFDNLLTSMLNIIFENSGADCGAIIVKDDKYGVNAYGCQNETISTYDPPKPLSEADQMVSSKIINHTIHTGKGIFIWNVAEDPRFAVGPWFQRNGAKSIICMPIIHKCTVAGCLLIEGAVGVFTHRHVTVLGLLCQQMGISITNAFLFKSVQRVTRANMRMIEMQKQALEEARRSKEAADRATRLREIFLANMSHEIRTPFSGFYGMISLLAETKLDPEQHDLVHTAKESCEILLRLIDDLLNFSKLQAGKVSLDFSPVIIDNAIADVVEMLVAMVIEKKINITYIVSPDVPAVVITDANRLRQVIINLLGNAIKFTHHGEILIRCSVKKQKNQTSVKNIDGFKYKDSDTVPLLFEVIDSGIGISEEQRKALFIPFSQVDGSTTRKYGGTGLGLSICMHLVTLMSGTIDVLSTPSKGSNFHFSINAPKALEQTKQREKIVNGLLNELGDNQVLVIDKYKSSIKMIRELLPGKTVNGACSIEELISYKNNRYTIVIIGFYLTHDTEFFTSWSCHLHPHLERARCITVLHYPTSSSAINEKNQFVVEHHYKKQNSSSQPLSHTTTGVNKCNDNENILLSPSRRPSTQQEQVPIPLSIETALGTCSPTQHRAIVRVTIPLRRMTFLKLLVNSLDQTIASPKTPRPVLAARASSEGRKSSREFVSAEERAMYSTQTLLAAEDNPVAQKLLYKQLTRLGFKVICANNGEEAVEAWSRQPESYFKMAFFDHHMPKCDGVEATKRIRKIEESENRTRLPIVTLTADIQDSAKEICMNAGFDEYLTKPINHEVLSKILRRYCFKNNNLPTNRQGLESEA
ncbi:hypothetical protein BDC45DRAFT_497792 [Circinella umbellata]|nr:hypothetical protein BDC45DRAFT_497792 [Circinella umbellata]